MECANEAIGSVAKLLLRLGLILLIEHKINPRFVSGDVSFDKLLDCSRLAASGSGVDNQIANAVLAGVKDCLLIMRWDKLSLRGEGLNISRSERISRVDD